MKPAVSVKLVLVAACALVDPDGRVLLAQRPDEKSMAGLWEFPGGKVEPGERPESSLIRELKEELGIAVEEDCLAPLTFASHVYPDSGPGTPYLATLTVTDRSGNSTTTPYPIVVQADSLSIERDIAIDKGLWWLHQDIQRYGN